MNNDSWKTSWETARKKKEEVDTQEPSWKASWEKASPAFVKELHIESPEERLSRTISKLPGITPKMEETYQRFHFPELEREYQKAAREEAEQKRIQENRESLADMFKDMGLDDDTIISLNKITGGEPTGLDNSKWYNRLINNVLYAGNRFATEGGNAIGTLALLPGRVLDAGERLLAEEWSRVNKHESEDIKLLAEYETSGGDVSTFEAAQKGIRQKYGIKILEGAYNQYILSEGIGERTAEMTENLAASKAGKFVGDVAGSIGGMLPGLMLGSALDGSAGQAPSNQGGALTQIPSDLNKGLTAAQATKNAFSRLFQYNTTTMINAGIAASQEYTEWSKTYGDKPVQTFFNAVGTGLSEYITENMFGSPTDAAKLGQYYKPDATSSFIKNVAKEWKSLLGEMAEEGAEEIINAPLQGLVNKATGEYDKPWFGCGNGAVFDFKEMLDSGVAGATAGGIMGFVYSSANAISEAKNVQEMAAAFNYYVDKLPEEIRPEHIEVKSAETSADVVKRATGELYRMLAEICRIKGISVQVAENGNLMFNMSAQNNAKVTDIASDPAIQQIIRGINAMTGHDSDIIYSDEYEDISSQANDVNTDEVVSGADMATGRAEDVHVPSDEDLREAHDNSAEGTAVAEENVTPQAVPEQAQSPKPIRATGQGGLTRGADIETVSERARKYAETGASIQETMDELVRSGLVTDVNDLTQSEGVAISAAWYQGSLDYKAKQKKKAGEVGARGTGERAETAGQSVSGENTKKPTAPPPASDGSAKKPTTRAKGKATTDTAGKTEGKTKPVKREGKANGKTSARTDNEQTIAEKKGSKTVEETTGGEKETSVETAKRKLKKAEDDTTVKDLGKVAKSIYDRITSEGLSFSDVTLRNPPAGFNTAQQEQIVRALLNADESVGESTRIKLTGDGSFTFSNDAVAVSQMLYKLGVRLSDSAEVAVRASIREAVSSLEMRGNSLATSNVIGTYNGNNYIVVAGGAFLITDGEKTLFEKNSKIKPDADEFVTRILQAFEKSIRDTAVEVSSVTGFTKGKEKFACIKFVDGSAMTVKRAGFDALNQIGQTVLASRSAHGMISSKDGVLTGLVLANKAEPVGDETFIKIKFDTTGNSSTTIAKLDGKQYSRQYEVKRTQNANSETTVPESKADTTESKAAKPESAEAEVKTEAGEGDKAISMQDVIDKIREDFGVQITRGYMRDVPRQASGRYDTADKGVRYRTANDVNTVAHELGHALDDRYSVLTEDTDLAVLKWFANTLPEDRIDAYRAAYRLSGEGKDFYLPLAKEGLADRLADYLTDAEHALKKYPKFKEHFLDPIREKKGGKADLARLERYAEMVHEAVTDDEARLRGTVHTIERPKPTDSLAEGIRRSFREGTPEERKEYRISSGKRKVDSFITTFFNKNQYIKTLGQQSNSGSCEAYIDIQNATYNTGLINSAMRGSITDLDGNPIGEGFHVILEGLTDKKENLDPDLYHEFGLYLDIVHSAERQAQGHKIPQTMEDALEIGTIERMEKVHPDFPELAGKVYEYNNHLLDVAVQGGLVEPEVVEKWREIYPHYVPMQRYFDQQTRESKGGAKATNPGGFANVNSPYKRAKGSQLDYYNPLDLIIQQTATVYQSAIRNRVMQSIVDLVNDSPNPAILMEHIPDDLRIDKISTQELVSRLTDKVKNGAEIAPEVADGMLQLLSEAMPEYLSKVNTGTHTDASRRIVTVMEKGQKVMYKVNDPDLFKVIVNMNPVRDSAFVRLVSTVSRGVVKMWTSLNPLFSFGNAARDLGTLTASAATEFGGEIAAGKNDSHISLKNRAALMAQMYKNIGKSWAETAKERAKGLDSTDPYHQEYIAMGGNESGLADDARYLSVDVRKEFSKENARKYGRLSKLKQGYAVLSYTTNTIERGPREAVYITAREMGLEPKLAYRLSQDVTTDFKNGGTLKGVSTFIPLFNAGLAGIYRAGRHWTGEHITSDYKIDPMTSKARQKRAMGRILTSVILAAAMAALQTLLGSADEENYKQLSNYTKNNFMCIPTGNGNFITIPKPREWAALQSVFERSAEEVFLGNEYALDSEDTWEYLTDMFLPNGISSLAQGDLMGALGTIAGVGPLFEVAANKDYLGRDIVPANLQDMSPKYQYNENTSFLAWAIGQILPISPLQIDHIGRNWTGGWWELMKGLTPNGFIRKGDTSNVSFALFNRWYRDAAYSTDIINRMYDYRDEANVAHNDNEDDIDAKIDYTWYSRMASFYSAYNKLAKAQPDSTQKRATRQTVLDMIEGSLEVKDGKVYSAQAELEDYVRRTGDTSAMPATMATEIKYGKNNSKVMTLDADQYVDFQLLYNTYYWNYIQQLFSSAYADKMSDASLKKSLHSARDRALAKAKQDIISKATKGK